MPEAQVSNAAPSSEHTNVTPSSLAVKRNLALVLAVGLSGAKSIVVTGGVVSRGGVMFQLWPAGVGSTCPSASVARTATLCQPTARPVYVTLPELHGVHAPPSSAHSKVAPARFEEKVIVALVLSVGSAGPELIVVSGAATAVQVQLAGVGSKKPSPSTAITRSVCWPSGTNSITWWTGSTSLHSSNGAPS